MRLRHSSRRKLTLASLAILIVIVLIEGLSYAALAVSSRILADPPRPTRKILAEQTTRIRSLLTPNALRREVLDTALGWRYRSSFVREGDRINAQGVRSLHEYTAAPAPGITRVAAFGDSFVYGNEVDTKDAWSTRLEEIAPSVELMNYGVGGYGVDQSYLRFLEEGDRYKPSVAIMGFVSDDLRRLVNVYRRFVSLYEPPLAKPRFVFDANDSLRLLPTPLRDTADYLRLEAEPRRLIDLGAHDQWYPATVYRNPLYDISATVRLGVTAWRLAYNRYLDHDRLMDGGQFNTRSTAFRLQVALFERFASDARARGIRPVVLVFPDREALAAIQAGKAPAFAPMLAELKRRHIDYVDLSSAFSVSGTPRPTLEQWFMPGGHLSPSANLVVARAAAEALRERGLVHSDLAGVALQPKS